MRLAIPTSRDAQPRVVINYGSPRTGTTLTLRMLMHANCEEYFGFRLREDHPWHPRNDFEGVKWIAHLFFQFNVTLLRTKRHPIDVFESLYLISPDEWNEGKDLDNQINAYRRESEGTLEFQRAVAEKYANRIKMIEFHYDQLGDKDTRREVLRQVGVSNNVVSIWESYLFSHWGRTPVVDGFMHRKTKRGLRTLKNDHVKHVLDSLSDIIKYEQLEGTSQYLF